MTAINWFGISRSLYQDILKPNGGSIIFISGGQILKDAIELAAKMSVPFHIMDGPEGASTDLATKFPAFAFRDCRTLLRNLHGEQPQELDH
jgi:hypothetical protein